ncbi:Aliphatic sulfonates import ATP-binding protein SsuB [Pigmentiphaga humi]|uniref:Aliphatic sulfonates import ATP-binding protein SsuB n=1 Tax=Pigmentiphaga humi TaxID=2478468 RepID=A0A3P4AZC3_9BURK|nr:ABC transporter ATP-binding protein [Pigmentiphaga humi]VCU68716.1 Aliphatic sulfonates import ATP-binding protein SsuB [Pigmentiphaga humi]
MHKIDIQRLSKVYQLGRGRTMQALDDVSLSIEDGEFVSVIGASGCGKTTLLRIIGGFEQADAGCVQISRDPKASGLATSTVFQEESLFPWLTAEQNVGYGSRIRGVPAERRKALVDYFIGKVGLTAFRGSYPNQLSGGMRQRVSVARAFANEPEILLMDEPFGALDEQTRLVLQEELLKLWSEHRRTVVFVTHNLDESITLSDRIVVLSARPGRVRAVIPVDLPRPRNVVALRSDPRYAEIYQQLWDLLQTDIHATA